jgi:HSP20 family protein
MTRHPLEEIQQWFRRMNRQFPDVADVRDAQGPIGVWGGLDRPPVDVVERDDTFVVIVDLPGYENADVAVRLLDRTLHIGADHGGHTEEPGDYLRRERRTRPPRRTVKLPAAVEASGVEATMRNGVLTVTVPKRAADDGRTIEIE